MIVFEEKRTEKAGRDGMTVTRTLRCVPYSARGDLLDALLGGISIVNNTLIRIPPARDPWFPACFCKDVDVNPIEVLNSPENVPFGLNILAARNYSTSARLVATYSTLDYNEQTQQNQSPTQQTEKELASEQWDFGYTSQRQPGRYWYINEGTDTKLLAQAGLEFSLTYSKIEYKLLRHFCIKKPVLAMTKLVNRVNHEPFVVGDVTWPAETVRYEGSHVSKKTTGKGQAYHEIDHKFAIFPHYDLADGKAPMNLAYVGWNRIWAPHLAFWVRPRLAALKDDPVPLKDRTPFLYDDEINQLIGGGIVGGFDLLFHPSAF